MPFRFHTREVAGKQQRVVAALLKRGQDDLHRRYSPGKCRTDTRGIVRDRNDPRVVRQPIEQPGLFHFAQPVGIAQQLSAIVFANTYPGFRVAQVDPDHRPGRSGRGSMKCTRDEISAAVRRCSSGVPAFTMRELEKLIDRHRFSDMIALGIVAAHRSKEGKALLVLDALSDDPDR